MKCPNCFNDNPEIHNFCCKCGSPLKKEENYDTNLSSREIEQQVSLLNKISGYTKGNPKYIFLAIIIFAVMGLILITPKDNIPTNTKNEKQLVGLIQQAEALYNNQDYERAKEVYKNIVTNFPNTNEAAKANEILVNYDDVIKQKIETEQILLQKKQEEEEARKKVYEESIKPPLAFVKAKVQLNVISNPEAIVIVENTSNKTVDAFTVGIYCYDRYDNPVKHYAYGSNRYGGLSQKTIKPGESSGYNYHWTLHGHENTAKIEAVLEKVHCTDGTVWTPQSGQRVIVKGTLDS